jgi:membrane-associated phospholipid phosphatase
MRFEPLTLLALCSVCNAAPAALAADDSPWLFDPVGDLLAAADTPSAGQEPAQPREPEGPISIDYAKLLWADTKEIATEPFHWDRDDWRTAGLIGGGLVLTGAFLDKPIRDAAQRNRSTSSDRFFTDIEKFGTKQYELPVAAGFYAYGALADDYEAKTVALDGFSASVLSSLVTSTIKGVVGRKRPNTGLGPHYFVPFQGDYSFPSGHATGAFAFASVIASHYDNVWVDASAYTVASLVGVARIQLDAHWASDVIAGGLIGGLIGHHLVDFNRRLREENASSLMPTLGTDGNQVMLSWSF